MKLIDQNYEQLKKKLQKLKHKEPEMFNSILKNAE